MIESLITLILLVVVVGLLFYALRLGLGIWPISPEVRTGIEIVAILILVILLLQWMGYLRPILYLAPVILWSLLGLR